MFDLEYHPDVPKTDIAKLSHPVRLRVKKMIESKLAHDPERFGEPLRRSLKGYRKLRVGDYRVIYRVAGSRVLILRIGHRAEVYALSLRSQIP